MPVPYHVFINHRGPDTKKNLARLIYRELNRFGLLVFLDEGELRPGDFLSPAIQGAINSASIHIAIFSKGYAESRWCLEELCWILGSSHHSTIIPVFCDVEPSDLRNIDRGPYAKAFEEYKRKGKDSMEVMEVMERWKKALERASQISGIVFKMYESDHAEFLEKILKIVLLEVKKDPLEVAKYPVGLEKAWEVFQTEFPKESGRQVIGIGGTCGVGKSTLAKLIFNQKRSDFKRSCYLSGVRKSADLRCLQRQLLRDLMGIDKDIVDTEGGKNILRNGIGDLKVLIVLDDVDDVQQINSLLGIEAVGSKSLILITSRNKSVLKDYIAAVKSHYGSTANTLLHDVKPLERKHAQELFCRHAFLQSKPCEGYEDLVEEFLKICGGLPLCLEKLGEKLASNKFFYDKTYWKNNLEMFSQGLPLPEMGTVISRLKWSYESMRNDEKEMLLDIGYFFAGEDTGLVVQVLEGLGYDNSVKCLESLHQKCLVDFDTDGEFHDVMERRRTQNPLHTTIHPEEADVTSHFPLRYHLTGVLPQGSRKIRMQNQVIELARHIVREELHSSNKSLRLGCCKDIEKMLCLQDGSNFCRIRGIRIPRGQCPPQLTNNINISGIRLLVVEHPIDLSSYFDRPGISGNLVWLRLCNCHSVSLPSAISLEGLRVLELQGSSDGLEDFFSSLNKPPSQLRELNIHVGRGSSEGTSSSGEPVDLQHLNMKSSSRNISHPAVKPYFPRLLRLIAGSSMMNKMVLKNLENLESLPINFSDLLNLVHLDLSGCTNLTKLPNEFSKLIHLQYLALRNCSRLIIERDILGEGNSREGISSLQYIDFKGCAQLEILPFGIASQKSLRYLNLLFTGIEELPFNFGLLDKLEQLAIGSPRLRELPDSVAALNRLKELILFECTTLRHITPIEKLNLLERLEMYRLPVQPILPPGIVRLKYIKVLAISYCPIIEFSFNNSMNNLSDFTLNQTFIPNLCFPQDCLRLEIVDLSYNLELTYVEGLPSGLVRLNLQGCRKLKTLRNLPELEHLKFLNINGCVELEDLNVKGLNSLQEMNAEACWKLQSIESLSELKRVNCLQISTLNGGLISDAIFEILNIEDILVNSFGRQTVLDVPGTTTEISPVCLKNLHSYKAILICFITTDEHSDFTVRFEPSNSRTPYEEYKTVHGNGTGRRRLHMYMWTGDSKLFRDENFYNDIVVYNNGTANDLDGEKGWIAQLASEAQVLEVCCRVMLEIKILEELFA